MNSHVRGWIVAALVGLAATSLFAPCRYVGHVMTTGPGDRMTEIGEAMAGHAVRGKGTIHWPVWYEPSPGMIGGNLAESAGSKMVFLVDDLTLDSGRLGIWWAAIVVACGSGIALSWRGDVKPEG